MTRRRTKEATYRQVLTRNSKWKMIFNSKAAKGERRSNPVIFPPPPPTTPPHTAQHVPPPPRHTLMNPPPSPPPLSPHLFQPPPPPPTPPPPTPPPPHPPRFYASPDRINPAALSRPPSAPPPPPTPPYVLDPPPTLRHRLTDLTTLRCHVSTQAATFVTLDVPAFSPHAPSPLFPGGPRLKLLTPHYFLCLRQRLCSTGAGAPAILAEQILSGSELFRCMKASPTVTFVPLGLSHRDITTVVPQVSTPHPPFKIIVSAKP